MVLSSILGMIDIYLIWYVILLVIGVKATTGLSSKKIHRECHHIALLFITLVAGRSSILDHKNRRFIHYQAFFLLNLWQYHLIEIFDLQKHYQMGNNTVRALDGIDLSIDENTFTVVMGPSGSGKSTLLYLLGGLGSPNKWTNSRKWSGD